jgi:hypothetical protein
MSELNENSDEGSRPEGEGKAGAMKDRSPEVAAFIEVFNYFRKPYNAWQKDGSGWKEVKKRNGEAAYAGDRVVQDALDGNGDIGMRISYTTTFFAFDIDTPGKGKAEERRASLGATNEDSVGDKRGRKRDGEGLLKGDKKGGGSGLQEDEDESQEVGGEGGGEEENGQEGWRTWGGWKEFGFDQDNGLADAMASIKEIEIEEPRATEETGRAEDGREGGPELKQAARMLIGLFAEEPSLAVRSPHGVHLYWALEEPKPWKSELRLKLLKVKREYRRQARVAGIKNDADILPSTTKPLRVPRKDKLLEPGSLEPMARPTDGEAFWKGIRRYRLEELIRPEVLSEPEDNGEEGREKRPGQRRPEVEESGKEPIEASRAECEEIDDDDILKLRPKNHVEAEAMLMPFTNNRTNPQLIKMIEGGKREGLSLEQVSLWILSWEKRSKEEGYRGDLFDNRELLKDRIAALYAAGTATAAGAMRFIELWNRENGKYPRNEKAAERALARLEAVSKQPKQSRRAVLRFFADIDVWRRVIDDAVANPASGIDETTRRNRARAVYPLPYGLLRVMYSGCDRVWKDVQAAGIVVKAEGRGGQYVPNIGRPQYYQINISG